MSAIDEVLEANRICALDYDPSALSPRPRRGLAVVTCMDTRLSRKSLGLSAGDAHLIRNAGGIVTEDVVRSLLVSHYLLGTSEFMVISHTDCGLLKATERELHDSIGSRAGLAASVRFHAFSDPEQNVREQLAKLADCSWIQNEKITVRGFVFDVQTGSLSEVIALTGRV
jgi:carbonic anhydrase